GEMYISGDGVARGYLNRADLTSERFIKNPFVEGERMYKTGDLAKRLPDGNIEYLGRIDNQLKIRGFRIELREIEKELAKYEAIQDVVVTTKQDRSGDKLLCAFVVTNAEMNKVELKKYLSQKVPSYMIPSYFIQIDEIPLTSNGKINQHRLPKPTGMHSGIQYVTPRNELESKLVSLWEKILGINGIGIQHNFFELGGHSLKAVSLVAKLQNEIKVPMTLRDIYSNQTIEQLSKRIENLIECSRKPETGDINIGVSTVEVEGRKMQIYLPKSYISTNKRYPVVYMNDGQSVFADTVESIGWKVDETLKVLIEKGFVEEMIVVGVCNSAKDRAKEYIPYVDSSQNTDGSQARAYGEFLINKIIPYIDEKYRTIPTSENRAIIGASLGAIHALWSAYNYPETFSMVGALSPSFWVGDRAIYEDITNKPKPEIKIWFDMGNVEESYAAHFVDVLEKQGFTYGKDMFYYLEEGALHNELAWEKRVENALILFKGRSPNMALQMEVKVNVMKDFINHYLIHPYLEEEGIVEINPVIEMDNGMKFSGRHLVNYNVVNKDDGFIDSKGYISFKTGKNLLLEVYYDGLKKEIEVDFEQIQEEITELLPIKKTKSGLTIYKIHFSDHISKEQAEKIIKKITLFGLAVIKEVTADYMVIDLNTKSTNQLN
ncbi:alpha/beta hydrolase-fold protein, partial [Chengkuizengella sediminis]|uniref:alpha/beta hydrolase-fold protein n=1 Tax=Chengkuizengella sediminis TaxID=1885917 RepID=UPI0013899018